MHRSARSRLCSYSALLLDDLIVAEGSRTVVHWCAIPLPSSTIDSILTSSCLTDLHHPYRLAPTFPLRPACFASSTMSIFTFDSHDPHWLSFIIHVDCSSIQDQNIKCTNFMFILFLFQTKEISRLLSAGSAKPINFRYVNN